MLQLPEIYAGGYMYRLSKTGDIDGVPMPQQRRTANDYHGDHKIQLKILEMLDTAPKGAIYTLTFHEEWDARDVLVQHGEEMSWIKTADGEWEPC